MAKVLYGQVHPQTDFDQVIRIRGTQTRIACKGKEWFVLTATFRVAAITSSKEKAIAKYHTRKQNYGGEGEFRLHNIEQHNTGRCSKAKCKEIFQAAGRTL